MRRILITGSQGFIGRHLAEACEQTWPEAIVTHVDNAWGSFYDCREFFATDERDYDLAFHCAAITGGIEGTTGSPARLSAINSQLDGAFFEWALRTNPGRIFYFSSSCAYPMLPFGTVQNLQESDIDLDNFSGHSDNTYGWVKLVGEVIANSVRDAGIPTSIVRPFAVYGTDQENCRMIPAFIDRALSEDDTFEVWGQGSQASDFIHVDDVVGALLTMAQEGIDGPVNLGTGRGATVDEVANIVLKTAGLDRRIVHRLDKPAGPRWRVADPTLLNTFYTPKITLEDGIQLALANRAR